jgi:two-component system, NtrC family, sensor histidine kinase GlrK
MRLTIFTRLTIGLFVVLLIMGAVNLYTALRLNRLSRETTKILDVDERILDLEKKLTDSVLSQIGYEKKFIITKDNMFREEFLSAKNNFEGFLAEAISIADTQAKKDSLSLIRASSGEYQSLVEEEAELLGKKGPYPKYHYEERKGKAAEQTLEELETLEKVSQQDIHIRMGVLRDAAASARKLSVSILIIALVLAVVASFLSTRSITKPLMVLVEKTREISRGVFEGNLRISSPPEVAELAVAVNKMCEKLKEVDKVKSEFFSAMSHELRTPLTSIREGISLLQEGVGGSMTDKQQRLLGILSQETNRLIGLVNSVLDLSKMEAGMMVYHFKQESLAPLIKKVVVEVAPIIEGRKILVKEAISDELPPLRMDKERILQALRNLIGNAVKFTPEEGEIRISAFREDNGVAFSVQDTGPGIPKENLGAIFEKFSQPPVKASEWAKGTGLGLAFVKHIITAHGGKVWAESEPRQGSTFTFVLPC